MVDPPAPDPVPPAIPPPSPPRPPRHHRLVPVPWSLVGQTITTSFKVWIATLPYLLALTLLVYLPVIGFEFRLAVLAEQEQRETEEVRTQAGIDPDESFMSIFRRTMAAQAGPNAEAALWIGLAQAVLSFLLQGMCVHVVFQRLRGQPIVLRAAIQAGFRAFLPVLGVVALMFGMAVAVVAPAVLLAFVHPAAMAIGMLVVLVVMIVLFMRWYLAIVTCAVERQGPVRAMARSAALTKEARFKIFVLVMISNLFAMIIVAVPTGLAASLPHGLLQFNVTKLVELTGQALLAVIPVVCYHHLRELREGVGIEELTKVFD